MTYLIIALAIATALIVYVICDDNKQMDDKVDKYRAQNERANAKELKK